MKKVYRDHVFENPLAEVKRLKNAFKKEFGVQPNTLEAEGDISKLLPKRKTGIGAGELMAHKILGMTACSVAGMRDRSFLSVSLYDYSHGYFSDDPVGMRRYDGMTAKDIEQSGGQPWIR